MGSSWSPSNVDVQIIPNMLGKNGHRSNSFNVWKRTVIEEEKFGDLPKIPSKNSKIMKRKDNAKSLSSNLDQIYNESKITNYFLK